jgi:succinate dehydrogenase/fumarate reductase cytochrome b subunit
VATRHRKKQQDDYGSPYLGHEGQWSWIFHRITGVAVILFLFAHVVDTAVIGWGPVLFHSINGRKITLIDFFPSLAGHIKVVGRTTALVFAISALAVTAIMGKQIIDLL